MLLRLPHVMCCFQLFPAHQVQVPDKRQSRFASAKALVSSWHVRPQKPTSARSRSLVFPLHSVWWIMSKPYRSSSTKFQSDNLIVHLPELLPNYGYTHKLYLIASLQSPPLPSTLSSYLFTCQHLRQLCNSFLYNIPCCIAASFLVINCNQFTQPSSKSSHINQLTRSDASRQHSTLLYVSISTVVGLPHNEYIILTRVSVLFRRDKYYTSIGRV